ncbi:MAG: glutamate-5-semialdehyde dehydrogenase [Candidatus Latescibacterota bacterium]|jgi:glutamate-5-semialdehyde dehydrogenase
MSDVSEMAQKARAASRRLAVASAAARNAALEAIAVALEANEEKILAANAEDVAAAAEMVARGELGEPLLKRLDLSGHKFASTVAMVRSIIAQPEPLGQTQSATELDEGLALYRVSVPIGVIGVIFESRPDALVQIACLCLKSGNAVLLKGGSEAAKSNAVLAEVMIEATRSLAEMPVGWMALLAGREEVRALLDEHDNIDLIIPRGGNEFVQYIMNNTNIPVMGHADGICHVYVDKAADIDKAIAIAVDSKTQYVSVCNAAETLLVHQDIAEAFMPRAVVALREKQVELRGDERARVAAQANGQMQPAAEEDWKTEYLDYILSVRVVDDLDAAVAHINEYGSHHTDSIVTEDKAAARAFLQQVDAASVVHNASTRFADGFRYGLGAEVGISTNRLHSRGPVGLEGLTIYKYVLEGDGHVVDSYEGDGARSFTHKPLSASWN